MVLNFKGSNDIVVKTTQSDFNENDTGSISFIENKPVVADGGFTQKNFTTTLKNKLDAIVTGKDDGEFLVVGSSSGITSGQILKMNGEVVEGIATGKAVNNLLKIGDVALEDNDFLKMNGAVVEGRTHQELQLDLGFNGIGNETNNLVKVATELVGGDFVKFTTDGLETRTKGETLADLDLEDTDIHTKMEDLIQFNTGTTGVNRRIQLRLPSGTGSDNSLENVPLTLKSNGLTAPVSITTTQLLLSGSGSNGGMGTSTDTDLSIFRNGVGNGKITIGSALTTITNTDTKITGRAKIDGFVSIGSSQNTGLPLFVNATDQGVSLSNAGRRYFRAQQDIFGNTSNWFPGISIYATNSIMSKDYIVSHSGNLQGSDDRIKSEEVLIEYATDTVMKVVSKNYFKHSSYRVDEDDESAIPEKYESGNIIRKKWESGVIAQDILKIPELKHLVNMTIDPTTEEDTLLVDYTQFIPFLITSIQELNLRIVELEQKNNV